MGGAEEDEPSAKRVKLASADLRRLSVFSSHKAIKIGNPLEEGLMAPHLPSGGRDDVVGSKGIIKRTEFVRIITKALYSLGYERSGALLEEESGIPLHSSIVDQFRQHILNGNWSESIGTLRKIGLPDEGMLKSSCLLILEQKLLEHLDKGRFMDALKTLRTEITPLGIDPDQIRDLAECIVSSSKFASRSLRTRGCLGSTDSRLKLLEDLQALLPPTIMVPERRLEQLVEQALNLQRDSCLFHNSLDTHISLYSDHRCGRDQIPSRTMQILQGHQDEVWFVQFSNNGKYLASSSQDKSSIIWEVHEGGEVLMKHRLIGHSKPVLMVAWSPDDSLLLSCGNEELVKCWETSTGRCICVFEKIGLNMVSCGWFPDGNRIFGGGNDGSIFMWDLEVREIESWRGSRPVRIVEIAVSSDGKYVMSICKDTAILVMERETKAEKLIEEEQVITSFCLSRDGRFLLLNLLNQELHLWSVPELKLLAKYRGHKRTRFVIRSCFGGFGEAFIASGSEDSLVYLWHRASGDSIGTLEGHSGAVNCVAWNPANPHMLASCSDDRTIRIWGVPEKKTAATSANGVSNDSALSNGAVALSNGRSTLPLFR